jgi:zinc dependent phospholipase C
MIVFSFLAVFLLYFLFPKDALAWGPGAHMTYALYALTQVSVLAPAIAALLEKYPKAFLYGTIAADIIFGKKFAGELYHCHHWDVALPLLDKTENEEEQAFIYGYLGHLAVDTVAHNYYVPYKIIYSYRALTLRHTYWEMRFDQRMDGKVWQSLEEIGGKNFTDLDRFLEKNLKRTLFSFSTNKKIFDSLLLVQRMHRWQKASALLTRRSSFELSDSEVRSIKQLCFDVLVEFLQGPEKARVLQADPSGNLKLLYAREMVKDLRSYRRRRLLDGVAADDFINEIRKKLRENLYRPGDLPLITDALH